MLPGESAGDRAALAAGEQRDGDDLPGLRVEVTVALEKIYGEPEIVDVQTVPVLPEKTA